MMRNKIKHLFSSIFVMTLAACGGSGGDNFAAEDSGSRNDLTQATEVIFNEAKAFISSRANDPASFLFEDFKIYRMDDDPTVCGRFNAKDEFGNYAGWKDFYYRSQASDPMKFMYGFAESERLMIFQIREATNGLIAYICSDVIKGRADAAFYNYEDTISSWGWQPWGYK